MVNRFYVKKISDNWSTAIAMEDIKTGELVGSTMGVFTPTPTRFTVQAAENLHVDFREGLEYINHGCDPNTRFVVNTQSPLIECYALRDIAQGDELRWDYATTEWDMEEKFECKCGAKTCRGEVRGAKHLTAAQAQSLTPAFSPAIAQLVQQAHQP